MRIPELDRINELAAIAKTRDLNAAELAERDTLRYQHLPAAEIPVVANDASSVRVIAGEYQGRRGAADTFTELNVWDVTVNEGAETTIAVPATHNLAIVVRHGEIELNGEAASQPTQLAVFEREEGEIRNSGSGKAEILLLSGVPIDEPVAAYGPFVMNTEKELVESINEFNSGKRCADCIAVAGARKQAITAHKRRSPVC